jgi:hypothetical protein
MAIVSGTDGTVKRQAAGEAQGAPKVWHVEGLVLGRLRTAQTTILDASPAF